MSLSMRNKYILFVLCFLICGLIGCADGSKEASWPISSADNHFETTDSNSTKTQLNTECTVSQESSETPIMATTRVTITEGTTMLTSSSLVASKTLANTYYKLTHDKCFFR